MSPEIAFLPFCPISFLSAVAWNVRHKIPVMLRPSPSSSCQPQVCDRCARSSASLMGHNPQLKNSHVAESYSAVLSLAYRAGRAKIPLLTNNFAERPAAIR